MKTSSTKPLNYKQKQKANLLASYAPAGFFEKHGVTKEFQTVGDVVDAVQVFHTYLHDLTPLQATKIYDAIEKFGE